MTRKITDWMLVVCMICICMTGSVNAQTTQQIADDEGHAAQVAEGTAVSAKQYATTSQNSVLGLPMKPSWSMTTQSIYMSMVMSGNASYVSGNTSMSQGDLAKANGDAAFNDGLDADYAGNHSMAITFYGTALNDYKLAEANYNAAYTSYMSANTQYQTAIAFWFAH